MAVKVKDITISFKTKFRLIRESYTEKDGYTYKTVFDSNGEGIKLCDEALAKIWNKEVVELSVDIDTLEITYKE